MMVSTAAFPDPTLIPTPHNVEMHLEPMAERLFAALAFDTPAVPTEEEFKAACANLTKGVPSTYSIVEEEWSPTYVLYSPRDAKVFTNECWIQVKAA